MKPGRLWKSRWFWLGLRLALGGAFIYAGAVKLRSPQDFADSIATFQLLPAALINLLALGLPPFEIIVGLLLVLDLRLRVAALACLIMTGGFAVALGLALARGIAVDCGCFGGGGLPSVAKNWLALGRDILLCGAAISLYLQGKLNHSEAAGIAVSGAGETARER